ncbi:MAG: AAA family ATPase [Rhodobacteraceae bacterium]|nr:AAA family ATPase [Paracoccaceae bacterium]
MAKVEKTQLQRPVALSQAKLRSTCDPATLGFSTTAELPDFPSLIGQKRAQKAIDLAAGIRHPSFNLYASGPAGTGRHSAVKRALEAQACQRPLPQDWVYVYNFQAPHKPMALALPSGVGPRFKAAMNELINDLASAIPALFDSEEYQNRRQAIEKDFTDRREAAFEELGKKATERKVNILQTQMGFVVMAVKDDKVIRPEDFHKLPAKERKTIERNISAIQKDLAKVLKAIPKRDKKHRKVVVELNASMAERAVETELEEVAEQLPDIEGIKEYLKAVRQDLLENADYFIMETEESGDGPFPVVTSRYHESPEFLRYTVNVMVTHGENGEVCAPVIEEPLPTLGNLTGRVEHISTMGTLATNFTLIKPGALHRANGGYLILDARRVVTEAFAWDGLKRCLQDSAISIISPAEKLSLTGTTSLEPDPIPLDVRVTLVGDRLLYSLLQYLDPDFAALFKIQADFNTDLERSKKSHSLFAKMIGAIAKREGLKPLTASGVARVIDEAARISGDAQKLSLKVGELADIIREADHLAAAKPSITDQHISDAISAAIDRASRAKDLVQESITRKMRLIDTSGAKVGQINGLSVMQLGGFSFGRPTRITANVRMGSGRVVDIEREVELGGPLHSKGVLILSSYLAAHYALDVPMSLWASLVFEQSYGGVDGDSASSAELYALLSALSGAPIDQSLAVTGSVNQNGEVQAIGGVNEKIEGFFDICKQRRLTGKQGVLIPAANVTDLMLREDVAKTAAMGKFHIYPVKHINEGIEILTGQPAGKRGRNGAYKAGSINARVEDKLRSFALSRRDFMKSEKLNIRKTDDQDG